MMTHGVRVIRPAWLPLALAVFFMSSFACAQGDRTPAVRAYPVKPIRMISPFAPGGGTDLLGRMIATHVSEWFGQPVVVDNRPGAGGSIGAEMTVRSEPDGYTLIIVSATYAATAAYRPPPYDPVNDIQAIILLGTTGLLFTVNPSLPVKNIAELIAYAKSNPGKLSFATVGAGSNVHLALELFKLMTHTSFVDVPYKGGGPAMTAVVAGEVPVTAMSIVPSMPHVKSGKVRALAVSTAKRSSYLPDIPAVSETVPGYEASHWYGMWGPKGLPGPIVRRWNEAVQKVLLTEEAQSRLKAEGLETGGGPPERFQQLVRSDVEKWRRVIREAKIKPALR
jgi:tripartite-type tricarboxylate transporter receptor subunit TctC